MRSLLTINIFWRLAIMSLLISASSSYAIELAQSLRPSSIGFEESAEFEIVITWSGPQSRYFFPKPLRPQFERMTAGELSSSISSVGSGDDEVTTKRYKYELVPTLSGLGQVAPIVIEFISWPDSVPGQLVTEPMTVSIANPRPIVRDESGGGFGFWLLLVGSILVVAGGTVYYLLVIRGQSAKSEAFTPEDEFLGGLDRLCQEASDDLKRFQTGLYKLLVDYLNDRFGISSATGTATDLTRQLKGTRLPVEHIESISGWLTRAEKEKFMPAANSPGGTTRLAAEIKQFFETKLINQLK